MLFFLCAMSEQAKSEQAKAWQCFSASRACSSGLTNLEVLHARYRTHTFPRHVHEEFCIGIIVDGVEAVKYRRSTHIAPQGSIVVLQPDEGHSNWAAGEEGWSFNVLYPPIQVFQQLLDEATVPFFSNPIVWDRSLFQEFQRFHRLLDQREGDWLELESRLLMLLQALVVRHAVYQARDEQGHQADHRVVQHIKDYLQAHYGQNPTLEELSQGCGVSPFHLTRVFTQAVGLPPHAYLTHLRIQQAKSRLCLEASLTQIAIDLGFVDQSHFTRTFKAWVGVTPGQYRRQMQA